MPVGRRTALTLVFIDVDGLKEVNDTLGHTEGDRLLRLVADTVRANVRPYDVVVRYGGDEFLCAMPHFSRSGASERMKQIVETLRAADTHHSISFGVAEQVETDGLEELISRADSDLLETRRVR